MSEFDQRIQQIQRSVDELTSSLKNVESAVEQASKEFESMSRNADSINQVASSVSKLERLVDRLEKSPFTEKLREQISQMNNELQKLDTGRLESVTSAIQAQTQAQRTLNQVQININNNFRRTKEIVDTMVASLGTLSQAAESLGTRATTSIAGIGTALQAVSTHEQQVNAVISALNALDPNKYDQSAQALKAVAEAAERISKANINISQVKQTQPRTGPTDAAQKYATEHNIDLSQYEGRVTLRQLRADTQKTPVAAPQQEVQRRIDHYNKLYERAQQYDKILTDIAIAQSRAIESALSNREINDPKLQNQFREAILSGDKSKQYDLGKEYRSKFLDVKQVYEQNLSEGSVSTELDRFKEVSLTDEAMIKEIVRYRKLLSEKGQDIKRQLEQANQSTESLPSFRLINSAPASRPRIGEISTDLQSEVSMTKTIQTNLDAINRALDASKHGLVLMGTVTGQGATTFPGGLGGKTDHSAVIRRTAEGEIETFDFIGSNNLVPGNTRGSPFGSTPGRPRSVTELATAQKLDLIPIGAEVTEIQADKFVSSLRNKANDVYSMLGNGETCATYVGKAMAESGILKQGFAEPIFGVNATRPDDVSQALRDKKESYLRSVEVDSGGGILENLKTVFSLLRDRVREYLDTIFGAHGVQNQAVPNFSLSSTIAKASTDFSSQVYRPASYAVSQFGAGLNSITQIAQGLRRGGIGGALDATGGVLKGINTVSNTAAYFGLGKNGFGEAFTNSRSKTLMDLIEAVVGLKTGYGRNRVETGLTGLQAQERTKAAAVDSIKTAIGWGGPKEFTDKLQIELDKNKEELAELRKAIRAYKEVLLREAEREASGSTGANLAKNQPQTRLSNVDHERTAFDIRAQLNQRETLLSQQATESLRKFGQGTGFNSSGGAILSENVRNIAKIAYNESALPPKHLTMQGVSIPAYGDESRDKAVSISVVDTHIKNAAQTLVHEVVHDIIDRTAVNNKGEDIRGGLYYRDAHNADNFENIGLHMLALDRRIDLTTNSLSSQTKGLTPEAAKVVKYADNDSDYQRYLFKPTEMFAHIGEALISGNKDLETALRTIYGPELFEEVQRELAAKLPDVFTDEPLKALRNRFSSFDQELSVSIADIGGKSSFGNAVEKIQALVSSLLDSFTKALGPLGDDVAKIITQFFGEIGLGKNLVPAAVNASIKPGGDGLESISRVFKEYMEINKREGSFSDVVTKAFTRSGGGSIIGSITNAVTNPNQQTISAAITDLKSSPALIKGTVEQYVKQTLLSNPGQIIPSTVGYGLGGKGAAARELLQQFLPAEEPRFRDELNQHVQKLTGRNIVAGSYQQQASIDPTTGMNHFIVSAQAANGAVIQLNAHVDEFGKKKLDEPVGEITKFGEALKQVSIGAFRQIGDQFVYSTVAAIQEMGHQLVSVQDELSEVANLFGVVDKQATKVKADFLFQSVNTAVKTGQGFDEAIQSNIKNFKILGSIKDTNKRSDLANQISEVQLGAQTAFGISLEQSLESIPSILATIKDGMEGVDDPTERVTASVKELKGVMDQVVVAQRATGAQGDELLLVYSRLSASAKEYGLNSQQLLGIASTSSVAIGKGSDETSNILRSFIEGTYSEANASSFAKSGIATKTFNQSTNQLENRSFEDILKDLYKLSQDQSQSIGYNQLIQSIAGPKLKPDIAKVISGFGKNYGDVESQISQAQSGGFQQLVGQKSQNIQGSLNKLQATGTQFLGSLLVGSGSFDKLSKLFDTLADSAVRLTQFLNQNQGAITKVVDAALPFIKFFTIGQLTKNVNLFSPIAKGLEGLEKGFSRTFAILTDFGKEGEQSGTQLTRTLRLVSVALEELDKNFLRVGSNGVNAFNNIGQAATNTGNQIQPSLSPIEEESTIAARVNAGQQAQLGLLPSVDEPMIDTVKTVVNQASQESKLTKLRSALEKPGAIAGSLAAPVGFDLLSGGLGNDNLINTAGAGIAGAFAGALTGPQGAIIGYTLAKSFLDTVDLPGVLGTSDKEYSTLATAVVNKGKTTDELKPQEQQQQEKQVASKYVNDFIKSVNLSNVQNQVKNQFSVTGQFGGGSIKATSQELADYQRLVVNGEQPTGAYDQFITKNIVSSPRVKALYDALSKNKVLLDTYIQSNVSDFDEFTNLLQEASTGKGKLYDQLKEKGVAADQIKQDAINVTVKSDALNKEKVLLEASNDIIEKINADLTEFQTNTAKMREIPLGLTQYGELGTKTLDLDKRFASQLEGIRSGRIKGQDAQRLLQQYDTSRASYTALPQSLQTLLPLAQNLGLNTQGLEQKLYNVGAEGQGQLVQRFGQADQANQFVQDYESRQRALKQYESSDLYKARDAAIIKEHDNLKKALATDQARYNINKQYLDLIKAQANILLDQTDSIQKQTQARQLISAGTPAQFNPLSLFDTQGYSAGQINKAIEAALEKQRQLEKLSPGYKKYFGEQQFLLQGQGGFKPVTGVDQNFMQQALQSQQIKPPSLEDLSQFSDVELQKVLARARSLQSQAVSLNPDLAGKYDDERLLIFRKNNQLLQEVGLSQEYLKLAIQENTKSNDTLRGHYNLPSSYRAPTVWDYYASGGKEAGDVNFPNKTGQGAMVPLSFAQQLAQEFLNASKAEKGGADLSAITNTAGPGSTGKPKFYSGGSPAVYSQPLPQVLPDTVRLPQAPQPSVRQEIENFKHELAVQTREQRVAQQKSLHSYDDIETKRLGKQESKGPLDAVKDALDKTRQTLGLTDDKIKDLGAGAAAIGLTLTGFTSSAATLALNTNAFSSAITSLLSKVQTFDLVRAMKASNIQINVTVNSETQKASQVTINNTSGGGTGALTAQPAAKTRIS